MLRRDDAYAKPAPARLAAGMIAVVFSVALAGCGTEPYPIETETDPPWYLFHAPEPPVLEPPLSERAHPIALCYGGAVNTEEEVRARAKELCGGGRLVLENENLFWNGCSVLQPARVTYLCDPPPEDTAEKK